MNIFYLDSNPEICAQWHCNSHAIKMGLEIAQLLSAAHHVLDNSSDTRLYKLSHKNHPTAIWIRQSEKNYQWAFSLMREILKEYTFRYGKIHKTSEKLEVLSQSPINIPKNIPFTSTPQCMPDDSKDVSTIRAYQNYYLRHKKHILEWKPREIPFWAVETVHKINSFKEQEMRKNKNISISFLKRLLKIAIF